MDTWLGQFCLEVSDLDKSVAQFEALGLECTSRTEIPEAAEAILENPAGGSKLQLAQRRDKAFATGTAFWKLYVNTVDIAGLHARALAAGLVEVTPPASSDRWPVSMSFLTDRDGYLVELVERRPWGDDAPPGPAWLGQYCINVTDLDRAVAFFERVGLTCSSRTDIGHAREAIVEAPGRGSKLQLAQHLGAESLTGRHLGAGERRDMGSLWKLYLNTDDCEGLHAAAVAAGAVSKMAPTRLDRWPVTVAFVEDPDGYLLEIVQRDAH